MSLLREAVHHSPTKPASTLDFLFLADRVPNTRVLLLSAEGKNNDILAAARKAISCDLFTAALTLTTQNPLIDLADDSHAIRVFSFAMPWAKDGYLATNTLVAMSLLFCRAVLPVNEYATLETYFDKRAVRARRLHLNQQSILAEATERGVMIIHGADATSFAVALESNLSEAAVAVTEKVDLRQFAHGRHLQLAKRTHMPLVVVAYQILTKRSENMREYFATRTVPENAWLGVSVEDRKYGKPRIPDLLAIKAKTRFLSIEPLLEDIGKIRLRGIHWVIVGGESGFGARPMKEEWALNIRNQCLDAGVDFFFKQWGAWGVDGKQRNKKANGRMLDGKIWDMIPSVAV